MAYFSIAVFRPNEAKVRKIWADKDLLAPDTTFSFHIELEDSGMVDIHANRAQLEILYKALDDFFTDIHKAERAEREAELYASAMLDRQLEEA